MLSGQGGPAAQDTYISSQLGKESPKLPDLLTLIGLSIREMATWGLQREGVSEQIWRSTSLSSHPNIPGKTQRGLGSLRVREPELSVACRMTEIQGFRKDILNGRGTS